MRQTVGSDTQPAYGVPGILFSRAKAVEMHHTHLGLGSFQAANGRNHQMWECLVVFFFPIESHAQLALLVNFHDLCCRERSIVVSGFGSLSRRARSLCVND